MEEKTIGHPFISQFRRRPFFSKEATMANTLFLFSSSDFKLLENIVFIRSTLSRAVCPKLSRTLTSTSRDKRYSTLSLHSAHTASCRGVRPVEFRTFKDIPARSQDSNSATSLLLAATQISVATPTVTGPIFPPDSLSNLERKEYKIPLKAIIINKYLA